MVPIKKLWRITVTLADHHGTQKVYEAPGLTYVIGDEGTLTITTYPASAGGFASYAPGSWLSVTRVEPNT